MERFTVHFSADIEYVYKYSAILETIQKHYPTADIMLIQEYNVKDDIFIFTYTIKHISRLKEMQIKKELGEMWQCFCYSIKRIRLKEEE